MLKLQRSDAEALKDILFQCSLFTETGKELRSSRHILYIKTFGRMTDR
jgi:hypothetical protein